MGEPARTLTDADLDAIAERVIEKLRAKESERPERERPKADAPISAAQRARIESRLRRSGAV